MKKSVTAIAHPNIALVKYWGNRDHPLRLPSNGSISFNLAALETRTTIEAKSGLEEDTLIFNGKLQSGPALKRVQRFMDIIRQASINGGYAQITSDNNFPVSAGLASSAAAFAALAVAGAAAYGLDYSERKLSRLARLGSGSAARSVPDGYVEWTSSLKDDDSFAFTIFPADHWELWDCIALVEVAPKETGSTEGHLLAGTSPLQAARIADTPRRLGLCRSAIQHKDFETLAKLIELDSHMLHAVMLTSQPPLMYWESTSMTIMKAVTDWRRRGIPAAFTLDAGPNVHVICEAGHEKDVLEKLSDIPGVMQVLSSPIGVGARIIH